MNQVLVHPLKMKVEFGIIRICECVCNNCSQIFPMNASTNSKALPLRPWLKWWVAQGSGSGPHKSIVGAKNIYNFLFLTKCKWSMGHPSSVRAIYLSMYFIKFKVIIYKSQLGMSDCKYLCNAVIWCVTSIQKKKKNSKALIWFLK